MWKSRFKDSIPRDGFSRLCGNAYCVNLWGKESGPYLQAIHFVFAIGAAVAPLIAAPFLMPQQSFVSTTLNESSTISPTDLPFLTNSTFPYRSQYDISCAHCDIGANDVIPVHESNNSFFSTEGNNTLQLAPSLQIWIPYTILSLYNLLVSLPFFCLFVIEGRRVNLPEKERENASDPHNVVFVEKNQKYFVFSLLILLGTFVFVYYGHETIYANFLYTFAISSGLGFTPELAAYLNAAYWGSIAGFRFLSIFCATKVTPKTLLTVASIGMSLSSAALALFGNDVAEVLWAATVLLGASVASVLPACISWTEGYIKLTGKAMAVITGSAACADISLPWLMGHLFSVFGMEILMYTMLAVSLATAVIYFGMQVFATKYGNRFGDETSQKTSNV
ncbi:sodium-dependent glucose transporter 1B-like isoform X3 [Ptychodera flava]|uniref:sodium-dependent glucose transporter 1B-like isoform X3 n=1 Tax=Ptychodera flava TaxID=63121 RepID=UPI00396A1B4D